MWGQFVPEYSDPTELERPTASTPFDTPSQSDAARQGALYSYSLAARLFQDALVEYRAHIAKYPSYAAVYFVHVDDCTSQERLMLGDYDYLAAASATVDERKRLLNVAGTAYYEAMQHFALTVLKYYVDEPVMAAVYPKDPKTGQQYSRATIEDADPKIYIPLLEAAVEANERILVDPQTHRYQRMMDTYADDRDNYLTYISRCNQRIRLIEAALGK
jgi:hypothetical protein